MKDFFTRIAKEQSLPSRAYFKLKSIQEKFRIIKKGDYVLDLGCYPGGWSLFASVVVGQNGFVVGVDLKETNLNYQNFLFVCGDILDSTTREKISGFKFDVVLSDASPNITGVREADIAKHRKIIDAEYGYIELLKNNGSFVSKLYEYGNFVREQKDRFEKIFKRVFLFRSYATKKRSAEIYIICIGKR